MRSIKRCPLLSENIVLSWKEKYPQTSINILLAPSTSIKLVVINVVVLIMLWMRFKIIFKAVRRFEEWCAFIFSVPFFHQTCFLKNHFFIPIRIVKKISLNVKFESIERRMQPLKLIDQGTVTSEVYEFYRAVNSPLDLPNPWYSHSNRCHGNIHVMRYTKLLMINISIHVSVIAQRGLCLSFLIWVLFFFSFWRYRLMSPPPCLPKKGPV